MCQIGDVCNYRDSIGVVINTCPLTLALNTGDTKVLLATERVVPLALCSEVIGYLEGAVLSCQ